MGFFDWLFGSDDDDVRHKKYEHSYCGDYTTPDDYTQPGHDPEGICVGWMKDQFFRFKLMLLGGCFIKWLPFMKIKLS